MAFVRTTAPTGNSARSGARHRSVRYWRESSMNGGTRTVADRVASTRPAPALTRWLVNGWRASVLAVFLILSLARCDSGGTDSRLTFRLVTGTENRSLVPMIEEFAKQEGVDIEFTHQGSVDTMLELQAGAANYDAVWPASSIWLTL